MASPSKDVIPRAEVVGGDDIMRVKKLSDSARLPVRGSEFAAGFDLAAAHSAVVPAGGKALIKTGLAIAIPPCTYARVAPRSGLAWKKSIACGAGVIDYDYRGEVGVILFNHGTEDFAVEVGDRIAQLILERISMAPVEEVTELPETNRGANGFGSTGVASSLAVAVAVSPSTNNADHPSKKQRIDPDAAADLLSRLLALESELGLQVPVKQMKALKSLACDGDQRLKAVLDNYEAQGAAGKENFVGTLEVLAAKVSI